MVHFWTSKTGPCLLLNPHLIKLSAEYGSKCLLVLANTDELGQIAHQFGVTSVLTVKFFCHGKVVHTIHGAEPDAAFHKVLRRFIARDVDIAHVRALESRRRGDSQAARMQLVEAALADPDNPRIPADLAKLLIADSEYRSAYDLLTALPLPRRDRGFRHDIGRRGLVALFDMLGTEHPLTARYRPLLTNAMN